MIVVPFPVIFKKYITRREHDQLLIKINKRQKKKLFEYIDKKYNAKYDESTKRFHYKPKIDIVSHVIGFVVGILIVANMYHYIIGKLSDEFYISSSFLSLSKVVFAFFFVFVLVTIFRFLFTSYRYIGWIKLDGNKLLIKIFDDEGVRYVDDDEIIELLKYIGVKNVKVRKYKQ